mgnify:CR=1 FL=1
MRIAVVNETSAVRCGAATTVRSRDSRTARASSTTLTEAL